MLIDYAVLRVIWWVLLGTLLIGIAVMDGFDFGIGMLLHQVAKTDEERRIVINTIGPIWEGNQVWLILGGGAIFAAWPMLYAVSFSGFYLAMLLVLLGLILRPVGFKFRSKIKHVKWRNFWDACLFIGGFLPALIFGVALGNVLQGVPFYFDQTLRVFYLGSFWGLLNPFALLCGMVSVAMLCMHGAAFLCIKTTGIIHLRSQRYVYIFATATIILFALAGYAVAHWVPGYTYKSIPIPNGPSNPLYKEVSMYVGAWLINYVKYPVSLVLPLLGFITTAATPMLIKHGCNRCAWVSSALAIAGIVGTVGSSMFPFLLPSTTNPNMSLTVWDASSSHTTLFLMLVVTAIFLPIIILYTSWIYYVLRGKVTSDYINSNSSTVY